MPLEPFKTSQALSLGVELELQLVSSSDFDLTEASPDMLELLRRRPFPGTVTPEVTESMIEIATSVHTCHAGLLAQLQAIRDTLLKAGDLLNVGVCGGGTHPFQHWSERRIFKKPRYLQVSVLYGYLTKQFTIFGQHVHVGCTSADEALFLLHALNRYVPHFIALSASSPFVQGKDTLFESARLNSVFAFPLSGRAPFLLRWQDFDVVGVCQNPLAHVFDCGAWQFGQLPVLCSACRLPAALFCARATAFCALLWYFFLFFGLRVLPVLLPVYAPA